MDPSDDQLVEEVMWNHRWGAVCFVEVWQAVLYLHGLPNGDREEAECEAWWCWREAEQHGNRCEHRRNRVEGLG
jgi:hypothetical protein